ncbi:MAG: MotA/TolQ/ExbB proton channel family protein [Aureispira sp.]|nr:MotA/TolQ/ExbB proton channel family protein [Aureispira sp.]
MFPNPLFLFQDPTTLTDTTTVDEPTEVSFSLIEVIVQGGPIGIVIAVILLLLSIMAIYILIERYLTIKRAGEVDENFMGQIRTYVQNGDIQSALNLCASKDTPVARLVTKGLQRIGKPLEDINTAVENVGNLEIFKLEKRLSLLATISGAAPMIGFFGTVTGMILSFMNMAGGDVSTEALAGGIYQALITTAFGLLVGIIAFIGYNSLVAGMDRVIFKMEAATVEFLDLLQEPAA